MPGADSARLRSLLSMGRPYRRIAPDRLFTTLRRSVAQRPLVLDLAVQDCPVQFKQPSVDFTAVVGPQVAPAIRLEHCCVQVEVGPPKFLPAAVVDRETAEELLATDDADYSEVVFRYLDGRDITRTVDQAPTRYTIDFAQVPLEDAL